MKVINEWRDAFDYALHLGFQGSGSIATRQYNLCKIADDLRRIAGGYPYRVRFHRSEYSPTFPYLGEFEVRCTDGQTVRHKP